MAAGWLTLLKLVPWTDVISAAPQIASGARKLWDSAAKNPPPAETVPEPGPGVDATAALAQRIEQTETALADLHKQMLSASEIITTLADQNAQLIAKMETMRVRLVWLSVATGAAALAAVAAIVVAATT